MKSSNYLELGGVGLGDGQMRLNVMHINIHFLANKFEKLCELIEEAKGNIDVLLICETFLTKINEGLFNIPGFNFYKKSRSHKSGGGVAIYIKNNHKNSLIDDLCYINEDIEMIFIETEIKKNKYFFGEIYRPPSGNINKFLHHYENALMRLNSNHQRVIIGTDQNIDLLKFMISNGAMDMLTLSLSQALMPTITRPTRITKDTATLIDNIYISHLAADEYNYKGIALLNDISDHLPCLLSCKIHEETPETEGSEILNQTNVKITQETINNVKLDLNDVDWTQIENLNVDESLRFLVNKLNASLNKHSTKYTKKRTFHGAPIKNPWMSQALLKSSHSLRKLYKSIIGLPKDTDLAKLYKTRRNLLNSLKQEAKDNYYKAKIENNRNDSRKLWMIFKELLNLKKDASTTKSMKINGNTVHDNKKIADGFCEYFANVGTQLAESIPPTQDSFVRYLTENYTESMYLRPTDREEVIKIINQFKNKKSEGGDGYNTWFLKEMKESVSLPISIIINKSLDQGSVPLELKVARVVPIYKKGDQELLSNYRPISVISPISKVLEKVMFIRLTSYMKNKLYDGQYGFRTQRSTSDAVMEFTGKVLNGFEQNEITIATFIDLSKAFDTIDHEVMLKKLQYYGVRGKVLQWFKSYLKDRKIFVDYSKTRSELRNIDIGVPQGSVLGPILFIIYTNDLPRALTRGSSIMFADDTTIYYTDKDVEAIKTVISQDLSSLSTWLRLNKLFLNVGKTNFVVFRKRRQNVDMGGLSRLTFDNTHIERQSTVKFLGILINEFLDWEEHISQLCMKLSTAVYMLNSLRYSLPTTALKTIYYALFYSHFIYGILLWGFSPHNRLDKIIKIQKRALRIISNSHYIAHTSEIAFSLNILKFDEVLKVQTGKFMYRVSQHQVSNSLLNFFPMRQNRYNTRQDNTIQVQHRGLSQTDNSFLHRAPNLWLNLSTALKSSNTKKQFVKSYTNVLLSGYRQE